MQVVFGAFFEVPASREIEKSTKSMELCVSFSRGSLWRLRPERFPAGMEYYRLFVLRRLVVFTTPRDSLREIEDSTKLMEYYRLFILRRLVALTPRKRYQPPR